MRLPARNLLKGLAVALCFLIVVALLACLYWLEFSETVLGQIRTLAPWISLVVTLISLGFNFLKNVFRSLQRASKVFELCVGLMLTLGVGAILVADQKLSQLQEVRNRQRSEQESRMDNMRDSRVTWFAVALAMDPRSPAFEVYVKSEQEVEKALRAHRDSNCAGGSDQSLSTSSECQTAEHSYKEWLARRPLRALVNAVRPEFSLQFWGFKLVAFHRECAPPPELDRLSLSCVEFLIVYGNDEFRPVNLDVYESGGKLFIWFLPDEDMMGLIAGHGPFLGKFLHFQRAELKVLQTGGKRKTDLPLQLEVQISFREATLQQKSIEHKLALADSVSDGSSTRLILRDELFLR